MDAHVVADQSEIFALLAHSSTHGIIVPVRRIDTHGAAVFLAGRNAYKVKRAVRFPFMDFSTLEKRKAACERELAVNRVNAPDLYLGLVPITRSSAGLELDGKGEIVEWAVHMRRFDENATLDEVVERGALTPALISDLARAVASSHERAARTDFDGVAALEGIIRENAASLAENPDLFSRKQVEELTSSSQTLLRRNLDLLQERRRRGYVRRCHGDLHLGNIVLIADKPVLFDALEFDEALATSDMLYDLAFLIMDLWERGLHEAANALLNRYLWASDEAQLDRLAAFPLFLSVRAAIRAKVIAASLPHLGEGKRANAARDARRYFALAEDCLVEAPARLVAIGGLSGTGKTTIAAGLAPFLGRVPGAVHVRSDIERKRMLAKAETEHLPQSGYTSETSAKVYGLLARKAQQALVTGYCVIADAVHARPEERAGIERAAQAASAPFAGLWLDAALSLRVGRVETRRDDASDATPDYVRRQAATDIGVVTWRRIDATGRPDVVLTKAKAALGL